MKTFVEKFILQRKATRKASSINDALLKAIDGKEIYYVEDKGRIHINGYFFKSDGPKDWRYVELSFCYPDMELMRECKSAAVDEAEMNCKQYETELTAEEVLKRFESYDEGRRPMAAQMSPKSAPFLEKNRMYIDTTLLP